MNAAAQIALAVAAVVVGFMLRQYLGERDATRRGLTKGMLTKRAYTVGYMEGADATLKAMQDLTDDIRERYPDPEVAAALNDWITHQRSREDQAAAALVELGLMPDRPDPDQ